MDQYGREASARKFTGGMGAALAKNLRGYPKLWSRRKLTSSQAIRPIKASKEKEPYPLEEEDNLKAMRDVPCNRVKGHAEEAKKDIMFGLKEPL